MTAAEPPSSPERPPVRRLRLPRTLRIVAIPLALVLALLALTVDDVHSTTDLIGLILQVVFVLLITGGVAIYLDPDF